MGSTRSTSTRCGGNPRESVMNTYATRVMSHYQRFLPDQYATIPDPEVYFSALGEEIETQVNDLTT